MLQHHPYKSYRNIKSYVATRMVQHWENSVVTQEDPCRDPSTQSQPQTLSGREAKNLCRDREGLCRDPNHQACLGTVSRHGDPCRNTKPEKSVSHAPSRTRMPVAYAQARLCAWLKNPVATRKTLSLHRLEKPYRDINFSVVTEDLKWAVGLSGPPAPLIFPFSFLSIHPNHNTQ